MAKRRRNMKRKWIWIGATAVAVVAIGTVVVVRRRHRNPITSGGGGEGSTGPGGSAPWYIQYQSQLRKLCGKPQTLTLDDREALINGVFLRAWNSYSAQHLPAAPSPDQLDDAFRVIGESTIDQACQTKGPGAVQAAAQLAKDAWLRATGMSGQ